MTTNTSNNPTAQRHIFRVLEGLTTTLSKARRASASTDRYVVMNARGEILSVRLGTWSVDLEEPLEVDAGFDAALVGGSSVVSMGAARELVITRLQREVDLLNDKLRVS